MDDLWDPQLSPRELHFVGMICALWASLEYEIFEQTALALYTENPELNSLPKELNGMQFTSILTLWKERVVDTAAEERLEVLREQHAAILGLKDARDALVHGMWEWSPSNLVQINTIRIKKQTIIRYHFAEKDLEQMALALHKINAKVRFPMGLIDRATVLNEQGSYMGRRATAWLSGAPVDNDGYPVGPAPK